MKYVITKEVNGFNYWIQEIKIGNRLWNGLMDNAKIFPSEYEVENYRFINNIKGVIQKL